MPTPNNTDDDFITYEDVKQYASAHGYDSAYGLMLLAGPEGYAGTWEEYNEVLYLLDSKLILNEAEQ